MKSKQVYLEFFFVLVLGVSWTGIYSSPGVDKRPIDRMFFGNSSL